MSVDVRSQDQSTPEQQQQRKINTAYASFKHNAAIALLIGAPILIAIPPRKLDLYTFSLVGACFVSANHLNCERTGRSILQQFGYEYVQKPKIQPIQQSHSLRPDTGYGQTDAVVQTKTKLGDDASKIWRGDKAPDWKEQRLKEEQEKLDNGEGYADMIVDQIWDVWNQKERKSKSGKE